MNWDDVRIFLAIARSGQILGAAKRLGLNHATAARRLTALETDLKAQLFTRRPSGTELTRAGEDFLLAAERMEAEMLSARALVGDASALERFALGFGFRGLHLQDLVRLSSFLRCFSQPLGRVDLVHRLLDLLVGVDVGDEHRGRDCRQLPRR